MRFGAGLAALALALPAAAQILGGPEPPAVAWTQDLGTQLPLDARFTDHEGRSVTLGACLGTRPVVLAFVYYECPMLCGLVFEGLVSALRAVDFTTGADFDVLVLSIDPDETPALAASKRASVLAAYGLDPADPRAAAWHFLVGAERETRAVTDAAGFAYRYIPERDEWAHGAGLTILSPGGVVSRILFGVEFAPRDLRFALIEASEGKIGTPLDQILLRCFHYDPTRGKYGLAILVIVRVLGTLTVALLGLFVVRNLRNNRRWEVPGSPGAPGSSPALGPPGSSLALGPAGSSPPTPPCASDTSGTLERADPRAALERGAP